jgi:hypothetical protein
LKATEEKMDNYYEEALADFWSEAKDEGIIYSSYEEAAKAFDDIMSPRVVADDTNPEDMF